MRFLSLLFCILLLILIIPKTAFAEDQKFTTNYDIVYSVLESGTAKVTFNITLTNNEDNYYASSYRVRLGFNDIQNISGFDTDGPLKSSIIKNQEGDEIELTFNKKVTGKGNSLSFNLSFYTANIAQKNGNIWEINVPGVSNQDDFNNFNVKVDVPSSFGEPTYIKPNVLTNGLNFTKEQLGKSGISISFGDRQIYKFTLKYHLRNNQLFPINTEIALPPTTNYQDVLIESIDPRPVNVVMDNDGNWLATISLPPGKKIDVIVKGKAQLFLNPKKEILTNKQTNIYLKTQKYWEQNKKIIELANTLKTPKAIYEYVVNTLGYDFSRISSGQSRFSSDRILANPNKAVCLEFTDLFVAIARAAGIPAREIDGFAFTENERQRPLSLVNDVLHAWPEYYDNSFQAWVMVDPTWENTTKGVDYFNVLDFDHFAFVIRGESSTYPVPAGGYKLSGMKDTKDIFIDFDTQFESVTPSVEVLTDIPSNVLSALPIEGSVVFRNNSQVIFPARQLQVESDFLTPEITKKELSQIPPYGYLKVPVKFNQTPFLTNRETAVKIAFGGKTIRESIKISPFYITYWKIILGGILFVCFLLIISVIAQRAWRVSFPKREE